MKLYDKELAAGISSYRMSRPDVERLRLLFDWLVARASEIGFPITHHLVKAKNYSDKSRLRDFRRSQKKIEQLFSNRSLYGFYLQNTREGSADIGADGIVSASVMSDSYPTESGAASWVIELIETKLKISDAFPYFKEFADLVIDRYGYIYTLPSKSDASCYGISAGCSSSRCKEESETTGFWGLYRHEEQLLLRDIHQMMFLTRPYLDLPVEGMTLEKWIKKGNKRGTLEDLNGLVKTWTPPPDQIGVIREKLFLAGHLFYHRFFQTWEPDNPWKRDFSQPFKPKGVPEIFRADYRRAIDPPAT